MLAASYLQRPHPEHVTKALENALILGGSAQQKFETLHLQSVVEGDHGHGERAEKTTVVAEGVVRAADPETSARLLAHAARCLVYIERDVGRAQELHAEAHDALLALDLDDVEHCWAAGLLAQWDGEFDLAVERLEAARELSRQLGDRWRETSCTTSLMKVCLEAGQFERVAVLAQESFAFEEEGTRPPRSPFIQALTALAQLRLEGSCGSRLEEALDALRDRGANVQLAYVLADLARRHLKEGLLDAAEATAEQAAVAAEAATRTITLSDALSTTARVMFARGGRALAREVLARAEGFAQGQVVCRRVRNLLSDLAAEVEHQS